MAQYRTAQGKMLDMSVFAAKNENVRAVGNMKTNARGDRIDNQGRIIQSVNDKINDYYNGSTTNPGATSAFPASQNSVSSNIRSRPNKANLPKSKVAIAPLPEELSAEELQLQESLEGSMEEEYKLEQQKEKSKKGKK